MVLYKAKILKCMDSSTQSRLGAINCRETNTTTNSIIKNSKNKQPFALFFDSYTIRTIIMAGINCAVNHTMRWTTASTVARTQLTIYQRSQHWSSVVVSRGLQGHAKKASIRRRDSVAANSSLGDMFSKGLKDLFNQEEENKSFTKTATKGFFFSDNAPSWNDLEMLMKEQALEFGDPSFTQVISKFSVS